MLLQQPSVFAAAVTVVWGAALVHWVSLQRLWHTCRHHGVWCQAPHCQIDAETVVSPALTPLQQGMKWKLAASGICANIGRFNVLHNISH